jgi:copper chaperone NosL
MTGRTLLLAVCVALACSRGPPGPSPVDPRNDSCASCRMLVSDPRTAAQLVAPGEEPLFFDDLGCLSRYLREHSPRRGAVAYVADHRTGSWVPAKEAVYLLQPAVSTPMGSHLLAYRDPSSRDADAASRGGRPVPSGEVFGEGLPEAAR